MTVSVLASSALRDRPRAAPTMQAAGVAVRVRALAKSYLVRRTAREALRHPLSRRRAIVLRDISIEVRRGELFGILGLNGAGKTTLLKILATLIAPDSGEAVVNGMDVTERAPDVRQVLAMVTADDRSLHWRLSAHENLRLFTGLHRMTPAEGRRRIGEVLAMTGLEDTANKIIGTFSSGMRQRLLVARALLAQPQVLLLDEPTRSLDPLSAHAFRTMLRDTLVAERGTTVMLATHNAEEALVYCDRIAVLQGGSIAAVGGAADLAARFAHDRYRIWTSAPHDRCFAILRQEGWISDVALSRDEGGLSVTCEIPGGDAAAAAVLQRLVGSGNPVSRFERVPLALSTLIGRIAETHDASRADGDADA